jgi:hypothetical protein
VKELWRFIRQKHNREVLGWLGGGLVAVAAGGWAALVFFFPAHESSEPKEAKCGGVVISSSKVTGTNITGGTITNNADCSTRGK